MEDKVKETVDPQITMAVTEKVSIAYGRLAEDFGQMATGSFPRDPGNRKAVLVLRDHDIEKCSYERGAAQVLRDEEVYILQWPLRAERESSTALQHIVDAGLARPGHMLVQSPYNAEIYEEATLASQRFAIDKHMYFSELCKHLGAKEVLVEDIQEGSRSEECGVDLGAGRLGTTAQVGGKLDRLTKLRAQMSLRDEFEGGAADITAAEELLRRTGLLADPSMSALIKMRQGGRNQLKTRQLMLSLSTETKSNLKVVGRFKVPAFLKLSAEYDRVVEEQKDYILIVTVRF